MLKPEDPDPTSNIVRWRPTERGRYRSIDFYVNSIAFRVPSSGRQLSVAITCSPECTRYVYSVELFKSSDRFASMDAICLHVTEMLKTAGALLVLKYSKQEGRFYFQPTKRVAKFSIELLGWDDASGGSVLPLLGFERQGCEGKTFECPQAAKMFATAPTTIDDDHPIDGQRIRTDLKLAVLWNTFKDKFDTRKKAARKATNVGELEESGKTVSISIQDGHLILCDYLFSLAYFALVRVNPQWYVPGEAMLLDLDESMRRLHKAETIDALFDHSAIPDIGQSTDRFQLLLDKLAMGKPRTPSGGNDRKILASYDVRSVLCEVVLKQMTKQMAEEALADGNAGDEADDEAHGPVQSVPELSAMDCLKRIFEQKLNGEKEASTTTDEHSW
jgi:hypothetical protein